MDYTIDNSILKTYRKDIWSKFMKALKTYQLIEPNDRIAICISGGKDSMLMAKCFSMLTRFSEVPFEVEYLVMDPGYHVDNLQKIKDNAKRLQLPIKIFNTQIFAAVETIEKSPCYICARMRRGYLYQFAKDLGCNKIALGHHYDDVIETVLMNMFYAGEVRTMMPKLRSKNFEGMELIRPFYLVKEEAILRFQSYHQLDFLQCACRFSEMIEQSGEEHTSKRKEIKAFIRDYKKINPYLEGNIFHSVANVNLDKVIAYYDDEHSVNFLDTYHS